MTAIADTKITRNADRYPSRIGAEPALIDRKDPVVHGGPNEGPLTREECQTFEKNGFLVISELITAEEVESCSRELDRMRREADANDPAVVTEPESGEVRSIFAVHETNRVLLDLLRTPRLLDRARQILGGDVYFHQSRINYKPGFRGKEFYWHSDFETWHVEDGMPAMRALSCSISLSPNNPFNGPLMVVPGSHQKFLSCAGTTPENHYRQSLKKQEYGTPDDDLLAALVEDGGIASSTGPAGTVTFFDCNLMHGSASNISPWPRSNLFAVYNSVENALEAPFAGLPPRPQVIANRRDFSPVQPAAS